MYKQNILLITLIILSIGMLSLEVLLNSKGEFVLESTQWLWAVIFTVLTILWTISDSNNNDFERPYDFGFLMYLFWPLAFPYYLVSTRGIEGFITFLGFVLIWLGPWLAGLVTYNYF